MDNGHYYLYLKRHALNGFNNNYYYYYKCTFIANIMGNTLQGNIQ